MFLEFYPEVLPKISYFGHGIIKDDYHFYRKVDEYILYILTEGELFIREGLVQYQIKKGEYFIFEPNKEHEGYLPSSCKFYYVHFKYDNGLKNIEDVLPYKNEILDNRNKSLFSNHILFTQDLPMVSFIPKKYSIAKSTIFTNLCSTLDHAIEDYLHKYENYKCMAACVLNEVFIQIHREFVTLEIDKQDSNISQKHILINNVIKYINKNIYNKFERDNFESEFDFNYDYLNRLFKKFTGYTIAKYMLNAKIKCAVDLIKTSNMKIMDIAYLVGIDDPYYFSKVFKKHVGMSPIEYFKEIHINEETRA